MTLMRSVISVQERSTLTRRIKLLPHIWLSDFGFRLQIGKMRGQWCETALFPPS